MNFNITTTDWFKISDLADGTTYHMQAKQFNQNYEVVDMLFTQIDTVPAELDDGLLCTDIKFKKVSGKDVYIRSNSTPVNIQIEEIG